MKDSNFKQKSIEGVWNPNFYQKLIFEQNEWHSDSTFFLHFQSRNHDVVFRFTVSTNDTENINNTLPMLFNLY